MFDPQDLITPRELCKRLHVGKWWIYNNRRSKNPIPTIKLGHQLRFSWTAVCAWLEKASMVGESASL